MCIGFYAHSIVECMCHNVCANTLGTGSIYALVFGFDKQTLSRLRWNQIKVCFLCLPVICMTKYVHSRIMLGSNWQ